MMRLKRHLYLSKVAPSIHQLDRFWVNGTTKMPSFSLIDFAYIPLGSKRERESEERAKEQKQGNKWGFT